MSSRADLQRFAFAVLTALLVQAGPARADLPGTVDPPGLKRFAGSSIVFQSRADYDRFKLALEKIVFSGAMGAVQPYRSQTVEGRRITTYYRLPERVAPLEALLNYETELKDSGFEILFSGLGEEIETAPKDLRNANKHFQSVQCLPRFCFLPASTTHD